jgi:dipeptidyl aminopeptidase/acylaminoacyl peptidase
MPWFESELWVGELDASGMVASSRRVAGGADESIVQPEWSPAGILHFMSDRTGWWNLYSHDDQTGEVRALAPMEAECARPPWIFGLSSYGFLEDGTILLVAREHGTDRVYRLSPGNKPTHLDIEYKEIAWLRTEGRDVLLIGGGPMQPSSVVRLDPDSGTCHVLRRAAEIPIDPEYISPAEPITFSSAGGRQVHGYYFMPHNPEYSGLPGELPPLVVFVHGGPTAQTSQTLDFITQVFTSRGIATVAVDYSGSTGHGREYRRRLIGQWGIVDAEDCVYAARYLVETGRADPERVAIRGGSSGGYAVLCALTFHDYFRAGTSMYGIADLELLAGDTHKLESHYMASLVGPYPEEKQRYHDRSPFHFMDRMTRPLLILQGLDDKVVPPNQAELMARTLRANHVPYAYVTFEGEGHGFRTAAHILRALEAELSFYAQVFGFTPADDIEPIHVEYLDGGRSRQTTP